jgi:hypothetical protein
MKMKYPSKLDQHGGDVVAAALLVCQTDKLVDLLLCR